MYFKTRTIKSLKFRLLRNFQLSVVIAAVLLGSVTTVAFADAGGDSGYGSGENFDQFSGDGYTQQQDDNGGMTVNVCSTNTRQGHAFCTAQLVTQPDAGTNSSSAPTPLANGGSSNGANNFATGTCPSPDYNAPAAVVAGGNGGYDPCYLQSAYNVASLANSVNGGVGQIVAIIDYSNDPNIVSDLATYRSMFGLSACPAGKVSKTNTGCVLQVVNTGAPDSGTTGWDHEISLDVDAVSAICPNCQILLEETASNSFTSLGAGVNDAVAKGANVVSNSYGGSEFSGETSSTYASYYNHPGVPILASTGDIGGVVEFPSSLPTVIAVGGTSLYQSSTAGTRSTTFPSSVSAVESVWSGSGAGCSTQVARPSQQANYLNGSGTTCTKRVTADLSAVANPQTGLWIYDSYSITGSHWAIYGGTSLASPVLAAIYALAGNSNANTAATSPDTQLYRTHLYNPTSKLYSVTTGNVGTCGTWLCDATKSFNGYNGPTGLGTPGSSDLCAFRYNPLPAPVTAATPICPIASPGPGSVSLSWGAVTDATSYTISYGTTSSLGTTLSGVTTTATSVALGAGSYYFVVNAVNAAGSLGTSSLIGPVTPGAPILPPSAPNLVSAVASSSSSSSVGVKWNAPTSTGGSPITGYQVYDSTDGGITYAAVGSVTSATATTATATNLTPGTSYSFVVKAINIGGTSASSNALTTIPGVPSAPTNLQAVKGSVSRSAVLSWTLSSSAGGGSTLSITNYIVQSATRSSFSGTVTTYSAVTSPNSTVTISGLSSGTTYYFRVYAVNSVGTVSAYSSVVSCRV